MIDQEITYKDFNGESRTEKFSFHLDKADLLEMGAERDGGMKSYMMDIVKADNKLEILRLFRMFILRSVGKRSEDGRRFIRNEDIREEFQQTNAYQEFLFQLANDEDLAARFLDGLLPADLVAQVRNMETVELPADTSTNDAETLEHAHVTDETNWHDFSRDQLLTMDEWVFQKLFDKVKGPKPAMLMGIATQRKMQAK